MAQKEIGITGPSRERTEQKPSEVSLLDLMQVVVDNLRLLVIAPLVIGLMALAYSFFIPPTYTANAKFLPPQQQQSAAAGMLLSLGSLGLGGAANGLKNPADQYVAFLKTRVVQDALVDRFSLIDRYDAKYRRDARMLLEKRTVITDKANIISIEFDDKDPKIAAEIANAYMEELGKLLDRLAVTEAQQRRVFFEKQLQGAKESLIKSEQTLAASGVSIAALNATPAMAMEGPARLRAQITAQEVKIAAMRSYLANSASELRQAVAELAALRAQLQKAEREQPASAPGSDDYIAKYREFKYQETLFELFSRQYEMAKIDESKEGSVIQVVDSSEPPEIKSRPKKALIAILATVGSGFLLLIFVFVRAIFRGLARDPGSAEKLLNMHMGIRKALGRRV